MKDIEFTEKNGRYVADFVSEGKCVIQVDNGTVDDLILYRHMPGMEPNAYDKMDFEPRKRVFDLDVPAGMMIRIISKTEVKAAKMVLAAQSGSESGVGTDLSGYATKEELGKYVAREITNEDTSKALVFNESDGGGAKFEGTEYDSFSGVNDGKEVKARALMYVKKKENKQGPRVFLTEDKAYYNVGTEYTVEDGKELAVKDDFKAYSKDELAGVVDGDKAWCHNHRNGGSLKYVKKDGKTAIISVDGQGENLLAQFGWKDTDTESGTRKALIANKDGIFYLKDKTGVETSTDEEIVTKKELNELITRIEALESKHQES